MTCACQSTAAAVAARATQRYGFTNQLPVAIGATGQSHSRRVMPLANVAWFAYFNWADPNVTQLEDQSVTPPRAFTPSGIVVQTYKAAGPLQNLR
jgi:cytochrome c peroxidase